MADKSVQELTRQLTSVTKELALASGVSDEYVRERSNRYTAAKKQSSEFDPEIESSLAIWLLKQRVDDSGATKILNLIEDRDIRTKLEEQVRSLGQRCEDLQGTITSERRSTAECAVRVLKSLNDFYKGYQQFKPGEHKVFLERLELLIGGDPISKNLEELFTNLKPGEAYGLEKHAIDNLILSVHKVLPFIQEESARAAEITDSLSKKAATQKATLANFTKQSEESHAVLKGILTRQGGRLTKIRAALDPVMKNYEDRFTAPIGDDERVQECLGFLVEDLQKQAKEISDLAKSRDTINKDNEYLIEDRDKKQNSLDQIYAFVKPIIDSLKMVVPVEDAAVLDTKDPVEAVRLACGMLEHGYEDTKQESETALREKHEAADLVENVRAEYDRAVMEKDAAEKRLKMYEDNFSTRVDEEAAKKTAKETNELRNQISSLQQRVEISEFALAKTARDFEAASNHAVADDIYTRVISVTTDPVRKSQCLANRGVSRINAGNSADGMADLEESYRLNPDDKVRTLLDNLPLRSSQK